MEGEVSPSPVGPGGPYTAGEGPAAFPPQGRPPAGNDRRPAPRALLEIVDRDGQTRQSFAVHAWPLRIGRALDNDIVLSDPHVAAHHIRIEPAESSEATESVEHSLAVTLEDTHNGATLGRQRLRSGDTAVIAAGDEPVEILLGRSHLRLRLPGQALPAELPLAPAGSLARRTLPVLLAAVLLVAGTLFNTYLDTDPEALARALGSALLTGLLGAAVWCAAWALMSKTFTRQAQFGWHVRVFVGASLALLAVSALTNLLAFAFSWAWLSDYAFVGTIVVVATALYFHLLAVEPSRHRAFRWVALGCALAGVGVSLWFNVQRIDQFGEELYMSHLFPPALRVARPLTTDAFVDDLAALKPTLDKKAREPARGDEGSRTDDD